MVIERFRKIRDLGGEKMIGNAVGKTSEPEGGEPGEDLTTAGDARVA